MFNRLNGSSLKLAMGATLVASVLTGCGHAVYSPLTRGVNMMSAAAIASLTTHVQDDDDALMSRIPVTGPVALGRWMPTIPGATGGAPKPAVISMPSPNYSNRPDGMAIDTLIMHHTSSAADAQHIGSFFSQKAAKVSAHYVVGKDGTIIQCVDDSLDAWHAGVSAFLGRKNVNGFSIGIEMCNVGDGVDPYTDAQYKALGKLVAYILDAHHIKWDHVTGHKDIALPKGRKDDPSPNFSYDRMKQEVAAVDPHAGM